MIVVFNPTAGAGRQRRLHVALDLLRHHGLRPELRRTACPGHATGLAREAAAAGAPMVVAAGGDGTIAEIAQGLAGSSTWLGVLPLGTANVLAAELGLPTHPLDAASVLASGRPRRIHPGLAHFADGSSRLFVQMLGAGFDAAVVRHLNLAVKRRLGRGAYVLQTLRELARYRFPQIEVVLDGSPHAATSVIITKGRLYAGQYLLAPAARPDQPGFQVALLRQGGAGAALLGGIALPLDLLPRLPGLTLHAAARVSLRGLDVPVQMDGDPAGLLPVMVEDAPAPITVLVP